MKRDMIEKMITKLFPDQKIEVVNYEILSKNKLNENGEWVLDTPAVFVDIRCEDFDNKGLYLTDYFTNFTGHEFAINKV